MASRLHARAHGGQIVVSAEARAATGQGMPPGVELADLGRHRLRDIAQPVRVFQVLHPELPDAFPPLRGGAARRRPPLRPLTPIVGREFELETIGADLVDSWARRAATRDLFAATAVARSRLQSALERGSAGQLG